VTTSGLAWTIDDGGVLYINGQQIDSLNPVAPDSSTPWTTLNSFTLPVADLNPGINTVTMTMTNSDDAFEGARLEGTLSATPSHYVGYNENFQNLTGSPQNRINIVLQGDWTNLIQLNYPTFGSGNTGFTTSFANGVTTLSIYSLNGSTIPTGVQNPPPHVGYSLYNGQGGGEEASPETIMKYFGAVQTNPGASLRLPAPTFFVSNPGSGAGVKYMIISATVQWANGTTSQEWDEQAVPDGQSLKAEIGNSDPDDGDIFLSKVGFMLSATQIPLDDLNSTDLPPLGSSGSEFQVLPGVPDGTDVPEGGVAQSSFIVVPEPSALCLAGMAALSLLTRRRRRRRGAAER
jgi:hypothetical protein